VAETVNCIPESYRTATLSKGALSLIAVFLLAMALGSGFVVSAQEIQGVATYYSQMGQDKWVSETVFPGVKNGFFLDVGSGDGTIISNTKALEQKGWTGICIDAFPRNMQDRTCQIFKEIVSNKSGERVKFWAQTDGWGWDRRYYGKAHNGRVSDRGVQHGDTC
jgi:hypothetical protein